MTVDGLRMYQMVVENAAKHNSNLQLRDQIEQKKMNTFAKSVSKSGMQIPARGCYTTSAASLLWISHNKSDREGGTW